MSSSNLNSRRITVRSRSAISSREETSSKPNSAASSVSNGGGVAALRKRSALGDMTNAAARKPLSGTSDGAVMSSKDVENNGSHGSGMTKGKLALRDSNGTAAFARGKAASVSAGKSAVTAKASSRLVKPSSQTMQRTNDEAQDRQTRGVRRAASAIPLRSKSVSTASNATFSRSNSVQSDASRKTTSSREEQQQQQQQPRGVKRVKTETGERRVASSIDVGENAGPTLVHKKSNTASSVAANAATAPREAIEAAVAPAKDEGWEDLDAEDIDDPLMVAEYVNEIFEYMRKIELDYMPSGDYIDKHPEITWEMRGVLVDWLIDIHSKFRLVPETLFLAQNVVDRFLSLRTISLNKLQLVGLTAMFIAAKYEEVLCPSVHNFLYLAEGGYTDEEILKAERYMLKVVKFNLSYASPMNFLRRISKADNYDIQTRTVAKFFMEISLVDHRLLEHPPSVIAAAAVWNARLVLERGEWGPTLVHYSGYSVEELLPTAELMIDYCLRPVQHPLFIKKYSAKKFMKAAAYVIEWGKKCYGDMTSDSETGSTDEDMLRVDLFSQFGLERPSGQSEASDGASTQELDSPAVRQGDRDAEGAYGEEDEGTAFDGDDRNDDNGDDRDNHPETSQDARLLTDMTNLDAVIRAQKH